MGHFNESWSVRCDPKGTVLAVVNLREAKPAVMVVYLLVEGSFRPCPRVKSRRPGKVKDAEMVEPGVA